MNKIFNSKFEVALRLLLILFTFSDKVFTNQRLLSYDFLTLYAKNFNIFFKNINGDNMFYIGEYSYIKNMYKESINFLLLKGLITINNEASTYKISPIGIEYIRKIESDYKKEYINVLGFVNKKYVDTSDDDLEKLITNNAIKKEEN